MLQSANPPSGATALLLLADGTRIWGRGFGAEGVKVGEVCFNTSITGYQEVMTDPSYAGQIVTFTFPHIGNVGTNLEDMEAEIAHPLGCVVREDVTRPSNFRNVQPFDEWMAANGQIGISGVDTRALTRHIRMAGAPNAVIAHNKAGEFDIAALLAMAQSWPGLEGMDLAQNVTRADTAAWTGGAWQLGEGYADSKTKREGDAAPHVVAIDYGAKHNIFRNLVKAGAKVTVVPAKTSLEDVLNLKPDGVFLSNGPGDPAATGVYAVPVIQGLLERDIPLFGICLGHQMLALAAGAKTLKMHQGHRGANHPVKRHEDGLVEITSMNHGFAVDGASLPANLKETHVSLFDGSNCGIAFTDKNAFGVQYHPEASPGPMDSFYLFEKFVGEL